jgi:hypothetical protein
VHAPKGPRRARVGGFLVYIDKYLDCANIDLSMGTTRSRLNFTFMKNSHFMFVALVALVMTGLVPASVRASETVVPLYGYDNTYSFYDDAPASTPLYGYDNTYSFYDDSSAYYGYDNTYSLYDDSAYYGYDNTYSIYDDSAYYGYDNTYSFYDDSVPYYGYDNTYSYYDDYSYSTPYYGYDNTYYTQPYYNYQREYYVYDDYDYSYDYWYDVDYDRNPPRRDYDEPRCSLRVSDETPDEGDYVTLSWTITDADHATLTGFGSVSARSGSERIRVTDDRTFRLSVEGRGGSDDCVVYVRVDEDRNPPRDTNLSCELDASDKSIEEGDTTTLEWDTRGDVRDARINQGIGSVDEDGGTERVRPNRTTTYRLTIEDRDGDEEECDVTVRVEDDSLPPPPDVPLVYLSQLPYTGAGDSMTYWLLLIAGSGVAGYMLFFRALPFALARVKFLSSETEGTQAPIGDGEMAPANVTRQDVRAFVSALAEGDAHSAREFARTGGEALFAETAVVLDDVVRAREDGTTADPMVSNLTNGWDGEKFAKLIEAFADATDTEKTVDEVLKA